MYQLAAVSGYSRELEAEADSVGFRLIVEAGYDYREGQRLFEHLMRERPETDAQEPYFFGSHPRLKERIESWGSQSATQETEGAPRGPLHRGEEDYLVAIREVLLVNAALDLGRNRVQAAAEAVARHLERWPESARGHLLRAEVLRHADEEEKALAEYELAARLDPKLPDPHRELGLLYRARGDRVRSRTAFAKYLELAPEAVDRPLIEAYLSGSEEE